jgi:hypothetical protein
MQKTYFHNNKSIIENNNQTKNISIQNIDQKRNVDINKLLNRIKIEKKNDIKKNIFFYSAVTLVLSAFIYVLV